MFAAILVILVLPLVDLGRTKGFQFRPLNKIGFFIFIANFLILLIIGAKHVEDPYVLIGQCATIFYFSYFSIIIPILS
jgi:ubiquinol-cytochrome c reductase cytochrome b subunit